MRDAGRAGRCPGGGCDVAARLLVLVDDGSVVVDERNVVVAGRVRNRPAIQIRVQII